MGFKGELEDGTASLKSTDKGASKALRICRTMIPSSPQAEISHGKGEWTRRNQKRGGTCGMVEQNGETRHGISEPETSKAMRPEGYNGCRSTDCRNGAQRAEDVKN